MKHRQTVEQLLAAIGGQENIKLAEHCATRLRLILHDNDKLNKDEAEQIQGIKGYFYSTGQHQFVFGTGTVNEVYQDLLSVIDQDKLAEGDIKSEVYQNMTPVQKVVRTFADILVPLIPALVTTGLLMGLRGFLVELGLEMTPEFATMFGVLTDTAFAFLPVLIAYSASKKFGGNPIMGIVIGLMMVAPQLPNAYSVGSGDAEALNIFGINIVAYQGSIFPAIIAGWLIAKIEQWCRTWVPKMMDLVVTPFLSLLITFVTIIFILGPVIQAVEHFVINGIVTLIEAPLGLGYIIFGGLQQAIVVTGLHHSIGVIELSLLSETGRNVIQPLTTASMAGQFGAAIGAAFLVKDAVRRMNMINASVPTLFGITEPLLFGVNLRSLRIFVSGIIGGAAGGLVTYLMHLTAPGMGITFIPGLLFYTESFGLLLNYLIVIGVSFAVAFVLVQAQRKYIVDEI
ncbi:PTS transporter subunit EIIC [Ignavigranum ruoffiae]|uniref:PTS transporter subunit EIIC n=1 Tax=Ignavigranum ruoffiae TaxID=89093 RepID=UPI0024AE06B5|nr:PTS transporter subunit EIIC [Ignavigranum ruoffiae]